MSKLNRPPSSCPALGRASTEPKGSVSDVVDGRGKAGSEVREVRNVNRFKDARLHAVSSKNMYSEHGLEARMAPPFGQVCQSFIVVWNWMPGSAEGPAGVANFFPKPAGRQHFVRLAIEPPRQRPFLVALNGAQELVGDSHRVVRVLPGDSEISLGIPVRVVGVEGDLGIPLLGELDDALDVIVRHFGAAREADFALQGRVLLRIEAIVA